MHNFEYYTPTRIIFGRGAEKCVGDMVKKYGGTRVLIHYGMGSAVKSGLIGRIKQLLDDAGLFHVELGGVVPNPHLDKVRTGFAQGTLNQVDFILAVGGGSVIDSAKAIAFALAEPKEDVWELFEHKRTPKASLPVGSILTISAAGSEMSRNVVILNEETKKKRSFGDALARPKFAIMNPELTMTLPDYQTAAGCVDIIMHTLERFFTNGGNMQLTDSIAEGLLKTVIHNANILRLSPKNYNARAEIMWASSLAHNGLTGCGNDGGDFATHSLEYEINGMFNTTHGAGLSALWGSWARYVYKSCLPRFVQFAVNVMGVDKTGLNDEEIALRGIEELENFFRKIGMPTKLSELGINPTDEQIQEMAESCENATGGGVGSARRIYFDDMVKIYEMAR